MRDGVCASSCQSASGCAFLIANQAQDQAPPPPPEQARRMAEIKALREVFLIEHGGDLLSVSCPLLSLEHSRIMKPLLSEVGYPLNLLQC